MEEGSQIRWGQVTYKNISMVKTENSMDHSLKNQVVLQPYSPTLSAAAYAFLNKS